MTPELPKGLKVVKEIEFSETPESKAICRLFEVSDHRAGNVYSRELYLLSRPDAAWKADFESRLKKLAQDDLPFVQQPLESWISDAGHFHVLVRKPGKRLSEWLEGNKDKEARWSIFENLTYAVEMLHEREVTHGDIRAENVHVDTKAAYLGGVVTSLLPYWTNGNLVTKGLSKNRKQKSPEKADDIEALGNLLELLIPHPEGSDRQAILDGLKSGKFTTIQQLRSVTTPTKVIPGLGMTLRALIVVICLFLGLVVVGVSLWMSQSASLKVQVQPGAKQLGKRLDDLNVVKAKLQETVTQLDTAKAKLQNANKHVALLEARLKAANANWKKVEEAASQEWERLAEMNELTLNEMISRIDSNQEIDEPTRLRLYQWHSEYVAFARRNGGSKIWATYTPGSHHKGNSDWCLQFFANDKLIREDKEWQKWNRDGFDYWYRIPFEPETSLKIRLLLHGYVLNSGIDVVVKGPVPLWRLQDPEPVMQDGKALMELSVLDCPGPPKRKVARVAAQLLNAAKPKD